MKSVNKKKRDNFRFFFVTVAKKILNLSSFCFPDYHPLVCGNQDSVHKAGQTVLEMSIHSQAEFIAAVQDLMKRGMSGMSSEAFEFIKKRDLECYSLKFIDSCEISKKPGADG